MNQYQYAGAGVAVVEPTYERTDGQRRDIVNRAISVQQASNTVAAVEFLKSYGIAPKVIERVLLEPARRRSPAVQ